MELVEILADVACCMFQPLEAAVEDVAEAPELVVEVGEDWEGQCTTEEVGDLVEAEEQPVLAPTLASGRPNFVPSVVLPQK